MTYYGDYVPLPADHRCQFCRALDRGYGTHRCDRTKLYYRWMRWWVRVRHNRIIP